VSRPTTLKLLLTACIVGAAGWVCVRWAAPSAEPEAYVIPEDWQDWKTDSGLRRAMDALPIEKRTLLKWWLVEKATRKSTALTARSIREALAEAQAKRPVRGTGGAPVGAPP
jgi:hypothetical protein